MQNLKVWGSIFHEDSEFFSLSHTHDKTKKQLSLFLYVLYFFMEFKKLKTYSLLFYL